MTGRHSGGVREEESTSRMDGEEKWAEPACRCPAPWVVMWPGVPAVLGAPSLSGCQPAGAVLMSPYDRVAAEDEEVLPLNRRITSLRGDSLCFWRR